MLNTKDRAVADPTNLYTELIVADCYDGKNAWSIRYAGEQDRLLEIGHKLARIISIE